MMSRKRVLQTLGLLLLSVMLLTGRGGYGQTQPNTLFSPPISINAFGSCPDASGDAFIKSSGVPAAIPSSLDLQRVQLRRESDLFGQDTLNLELQVFGPMPPTFDNFLSVYFYVIDLDHNRNTGRRDNVFGLGEDMSVVAQFQRGFAPFYFVLLWPADGSGDPLTLRIVTPSFDSVRRRMVLQIPVAQLDAQYRTLRGSPLPLDDPDWGLYTVFYRNNINEESTADVFPERGLHSTALRPGAEYIDKELLVRFKDGITSEQAQAIITQLGTQIIRFFDLFNIYHVKIVDGTDALAKLQQFQSRPEVAVAEIDGIWCLLGPPNDPGFSLQWNLLNLGQNHPVGRGGDRKGLSGADIQISRAWDKGRTDSASVLIGVIDSGVDLENPDLKANLRPELGYDFVQNNATPRDNLGHGTFVSSIIGASGNNGADLTGISWKAAIVPLKAADRLSFFQNLLRMISGVTWDNFLQAMDRAVKLRDRNLRVVNFSAGGPLKSELLGEVIRLVGEKGILFVTAAGNDGKNLENYPIYPCAYNEPNMICAAASTDQDKLASFSNFSAVLVQLAAPGADVVGLIPTALMPEGETLLGDAESRRVTNFGGVATSSGTSFAAPHVTAVAALLFANCPASITVAEIKKAMLDAAERRPELVGKVLSGGRLRWPEKLPC